MTPLICQSSEELVGCRGLCSVAIAKRSNPEDVANARTQALRQRGYSAALRKPRHPSNRQKGMTLIEVIISISLVSMLMGAVYALYIFSMNFRQDVVNQASEVAAWRSIMRRVTCEFRFAMVYPIMERDAETGEPASKDFGLRGNNWQMQFVAARLPGPAAWARPSLIDGPIPPEPDVEMISYSIRYDEEAEEYEGLERSSAKVLGLERQQDVSHVRLISAKVKLLYIRYWDGSGWVNSWDGKDLPVAVDIWMGPNPAVEELEDNDDPDEVVAILADLGASRRIIYVPGSTQSLALMQGSGASAPGSSSRPGGGQPGGMR
ncbi:MAG TPA: type II secretion system protein [Phycisphaerae bacterium]|nr:type II secretion system protein [Phycisphaerae bacterium]